MELKKILLTALTGIVLIPGLINAGGTNYNSLFGARTLSLNGLYIAGVDGLNSSFPNPATLSYMTGRSVSLSLADLMEKQEFEGARNGLYRSYRNDNFNLSGSVYWNLSPGFTVALAYQPMVSYEVDWPFATYTVQDSNAVISAYDMTNRLTVDAISPSAALNLGSFSVGVSANIYHVKQFFAFPLENYTSKGRPGYQMEYDMSAWAYGFTLGVTADVTGDLRIGAMARSGFKAKIKGNAKTNQFADLAGSVTDAEVSSNYEIPWQAGVGIIYKMSESLSLNLDAGYSLWGSTQKSIAMNVDNAVWQNGLSAMDSLTGSAANSFALNFKNTINAGLGLEYTPQQGMTYRLGYRYSQSPNSDETYNLLFPGVDQHWFSFGIGYRDENYTIDATFAYSVGVKKDINRGSLSAASGSYSSDNFVPAVSINYAF